MMISEQTLIPLAALYGSLLAINIAMVIHSKNPDSQKKLLLYPPAAMAPLLLVLTLSAGDNTYNVLTWSTEVLAAHLLVVLLVKATMQLLSHNRE